ncbi:hypothetical protein V5E97_08700 [Singulisphaera sp. Ch08]|uniref:Carboxypeptidase regulatory-like domain-containing protein n=1 Tax=Singulisphaera sp. Ch08 TaxID=3120278 RepID=A0AAU7CKX6_9BACT
MWKHTIRSANVAAAFLLLQFLVGCSGDSDNLPREGLSGTVAVEGKPLAKGLITFLPDSAEVTTQGGSIILDGKYDIPRGQGLVPGKYKVVITAPDDKGGVITDKTNNAPGMPPVILKETIPPQYNSGSLLTAEVKAGAKNVFEFNLTNATMSK